MTKLLKQMRQKDWLMAGLCAILVLGQIYFDLRLLDGQSGGWLWIFRQGSCFQ